jgi:glycosyltransferase involved in cell wall biosynthesis
MKIALNGMFWGLDTTGSGQYTGALLRALTRLSAAEEYLLFAPARSMAAGRGAQGWTTRALPTPFDHLHENVAKVWFEQVAFPRACRGAGVAVAHVPYFAPPLRPTVPTVVTIHDLIPLILPAYRGSLAVRGYMRLVARAAHRAALVLTDSEASARDIEQFLRLPRAALRVIHLAADAIYRPLSPQERAEALARLGTPPRYLLYLGGFDRRKNVTGVLNAFARLAAAEPEIKLVIAGRLPQQDSFFAPDPRPLAAQLGLAERVHYTGWVAEEDKPALYGGAIALAFPSYYEGFGLPVLEALSCGTPAVIGAGSSLGEIAGEGGISVPPGDTAALAEALRALVQDEALRERLAAAGLRHAARFSWEATARQTLAAYREAGGAC